MLRVLEHQTNLAAELFPVIFLSPHIFSVIQNLAGCWLYQRIQMLDQRGFSASCVSDDPDKLAVRDYKADILQRMALIGCPGAVGIGYIFLIRLT